MAVKLEMLTKNAKGLFISQIEFFLYLAQQANSDPYVPELRLKNEKRR